MNDKSSAIVEDFRWLTPSSEHPWGLWLAIGLVVFLVAAAVVFFLLRRRKKGLTFLRQPEPHEKALKALRELGALMREDNDREFVNKVSLVVREYIQDRFGLRAPHRSTEEFLLEARHSEALDDGHQRLLGGFLAQCDLVKFARQRVLLSGMQDLFQSAKNFIEGTIPERTVTEVKK